MAQSQGENLEGRVKIRGTREKIDAMGRKGQK